MGGWGKAALAALTSLAALTACSSSGQAPPLLQTSFEQVVKEDLPKVVEINVPNGTIGSGVVFDDKGDIVTNAHVVGTESMFSVTQTAGTPALPARLIGADRGHDLAVIQVTKHADHLRPVTWADSNDAQVGEVVLAMGTPLGVADTVTNGIVSATSRTVDELSPTGGKPLTIRHAIQTTADINPGNSGGGLVDLKGDVLGIPTVELVDPQLGEHAAGISFAIPSNTVVIVARELIAKGPQVFGPRARR